MKTHIFTYLYVLLILAITQSCNNSKEDDEPSNPKMYCWKVTRTLSSGVTETTYQWATETDVQQNDCLYELASADDEHSCNNLRENGQYGTINGITYDNTIVRCWQLTINYISADETISSETTYSWTTEYQIVLTAERNLPEPTNQSSVTYNYKEAEADDSESCFSQNWQSNDKSD